MTFTKNGSYGLEYTVTVPSGYILAGVFDITNCSGVNAGTGYFVIGSTGTQKVYMMYYAGISDSSKTVYPKINVLFLKKK